MYLYIKISLSEVRMATSLPSYRHFDTADDPTRSDRWASWLSGLKILFIGMDLDEIVPLPNKTLSDEEKHANAKIRKRQRALVLHYGGEELQLQFSAIPDATKGDDFDFKKAIKALDDIYKAGDGVELQEFKFRDTKQNEGESIDAYVIRLRQLAKFCQFNDDDRELKSQIIQHTTSSRLRRKAIRESLGLADILKAARAYEASERAARQMEGERPKPAEQVNKVQQHWRKSKSQGKPVQKKKEGRQCFKCAGNWPHEENNKCPASSHRCNKCNKEGHFEKCCLKGKPTPWRDVNNVNEEADSSSSDDYAFSVSASTEKLPHVMVNISQTPIKMIADTGASVNILAEGDFQRLENPPELTMCSSKVYGFGHDAEIPVLGECKVEIEFKKKTVKARVVVAHGETGSILSYKTCVALEIVNAIEINKVICTPEDIFEEFKEVFEGMGKLKGVTVKFHVDESVTPVAQKHFKQPFHLRKKIEAKINEMEKLDLIEKVEGPTPWVSPILTVPKAHDPGDFRICVDMRAPNVAIKRTRHVTPTLEDLVNDLNGATVFSKLDMNSAYHQLELEEDSRSLTTFSTHVGLRRYKRLIFGVNCAAEIFQDALSTALHGINGVKNVWDDIIVFGSTQEEHDNNLRKTLDRLRERGITLNKKKCKFNQESLTFFGHIFSKEGIQADPTKIEAIVKMPAPEDATAVRSFLGMTNYVSRFIPDYADLTAPLRVLTKHDVKFKWQKAHEDAFQLIKTQLTDSKSRVMTYFDPKRRTAVITDASPVGISAILEQEGKVVCYASRSLTEVETRYSQTEREGLAIVWACEYLNVYLYGAEFDLITDHRPLEVIFNNPCSKPPARIARWSIR